jgi:hypothetical protein
VSDESNDQINADISNSLHAKGGIILEKKAAAAAAAATAKKEKKTARYKNT